MVSSVVGNGMFGIAMSEYLLVHSSRLHEVIHAALPQRSGSRHRYLRRRADQAGSAVPMRRPFISFTAWTTVVTVVLSALWLALIEEQIRSKGDNSPRSIGMRVAESQHDARAQDRRLATPAALAAATADPANSPTSVRAQALAWTR
jgi:hypothetical protein